MQIFIEKFYHEVLDVGIGILYIPVTSSHLEPQMTIKNPSAQQEAIFAEFKTGGRNVVVRARAGTGKTTTTLPPNSN